MKTKIGAAIIGLLFLMACGSDKPKTEEQTQDQTAASTKFALKATNMMYLVIGPDSVLVANQADPTKAEVFEKVDMGNGKCALKAASNGKFVSSDLGHNYVVDVIRDAASGWETFEIIALDPTTINIKDSNGKFISADLGADSRLSANRDQASTWETFYLEPR
jgi:hypothetical protein